jgi:hypothetical protein
MKFPIVKKLALGAVETERGEKMIHRDEYRSMKNGEKKVVQDE